MAFAKTVADAARAERMNLGNIFVVGVFGERPWSVRGVCQRHSGCCCRIERSWKSEGRFLNSANAPAVVIPCLHNRAHAPTRHLCAFTCSRRLITRCLRGGLWNASTSARPCCRLPGGVGQTRAMRPSLPRSARNCEAVEILLTVPERRLDLSTSSTVRSAGSPWSCLAWRRRGLTCHAGRRSKSPWGTCQEVQEPGNPCETAL